MRDRNARPGKLRHSKPARAQRAELQWLIPAMKDKYYEDQERLFMAQEHKNMWPSGCMDAECPVCFPQRDF